MSKEIYFVDDDKNFLHAMKLIMRKTTFKIKTFSEPLEMLAEIQAGWQGIIVTDLHMPLIDGFEVLDRVKKIDEGIPVIVLTGNGEVENVLKALRSGAYDFLEKPLSKEYLISSANRALEKRQLSIENKTLRLQIKKKSGAKEFIAQASSMLRLKDTLKTIALSDANIMLIGETGAGKEVISNYIHDSSARKDNKFTAINCGAIPENLMDSELFGHEAGAFTGAVSSRKGKFEECHGGTLFLDEVNSMPMSMQVKLLRFLEERVIEKVGSNKLISVDVRVIAASQVPLKQVVDKGGFREDLYYRLNVIPIKIPSLKDRPEDIPLLFKHFLFQFCTQYQRELIDVSQDILNKLIAYDWPGNVRELRNTAERYVITGMLSEDLQVEQNNTDSTYISSFSSPETSSIADKVGLYEKHLIENELTAQGGSVVNTCASLDVPRKTLYDKMKKYDIKPADFKK
ncbi:sigma-54 dependent transcriptional regulator [Lentisphaera profundi]|uniref:Sigma-54 dependent transcriptional regulator n=1 Tax=Lentisphaera profundi TaxID=1658616 RepID=A0ABY7VWC8_9BACT|nr:sigma-54 dependent transcriptional regulator [Lentisphaera profundi]WDE98541.1 sigma-54 dependent transcriptional regulator [Lentisphaera profundi]